VVAKDIAAELGVSEDSVRRDLRDLAAAGLCQQKPNTAGQTWGLQRHLLPEQPQWHQDFERQLHPS
jgi:DeoR/GlpR family transcriptional regulator of sugar metabolism